MKNDIEKYVVPWTEKPFPKTIQDEAKEVLASLKEKTENPNIDAYTVPLDFGTGGIRGKLGYGIGRINEYTIARVALGFFRYLKSKCKTPLVVIAYDTRKKSKTFSNITALIAIQLDMKVKLFRKPAPTPLLSFAVQRYKASGGVVITASHNPDTYNGFKAYLSYGGQVISPFDKEITGFLDKIENWKEVLWDRKENPIYSSKVDFVLEDCFEEYKNLLENSFIISDKITKRERKKVKVVYTALHGTGSWYIKNLLSSFGYKNFFPVPEQTKINGRFDTVKTPNPEDKEALKMAHQLAIQEEADIFIGTDPDADRVGIGVLDKFGTYQYLNGNQIGSIMSAYLCEKAQSQENENTYYLLKTIVTTDLQEIIAKKNQVVCRNLLTGFKYIAEYIEKLEKKKNHQFLLGTEESYGYLPISYIRDKDALSSTLLILEILTEKKSLEKKDLVEYLDDIFLKYGLFQESLFSLELEGSEGTNKIEKIMFNIRKKDWIGKEIYSRKIEGLLDFQNQKSFGKSTNSVFKELPTSNVIQFLLENKGKITIRPSGTEPKIKLYFSLMNDKSKNLRELQKNKVVLLDELEQIQNKFLKILKLK